MRLGYPRQQALWQAIRQRRRSCSTPASHDVLKWQLTANPAEGREEARPLGHLPWWTATAAFSVDRGHAGVAGPRRAFCCAWRA
ncbi:MAG: hypothetical protein WKG07_33850 [Hymenobacter sp.]